MQLSYFLLAIRMAPAIRDCFNSNNINTIPKQTLTLSQLRNRVFILPQIPYWRPSLGPNQNNILNQNITNFSRHLPVSSLLWVLQNQQNSTNHRKIPKRGKLILDSNYRFLMVFPNDNSVILYKGCVCL